MMTIVYFADKPSNPIASGATMQIARLLGLGLLPVMAFAALLFLAQRLAVEAYWEIHPEAKLQAEFRRPLVQRALIDLRNKRQTDAQEEARKQEDLEKYFEQWGLSKAQVKELVNSQP